MMGQQQQQETAKCHSWTADERGGGIRKSRDVTLTASSSLLSVGRLCWPFEQEEGGVAGGGGRRRRIYQEKKRYTTSYLSSSSSNERWSPRRGRRARSSIFFLFPPLFFPPWFLDGFFFLPFIFIIHLILCHYRRKLHGWCVCVFTGSSYMSSLSLYVMRCWPCSCKSRMLPSPLL